ncbi:MAG: META domain-containing protein [Bacilli bacterium]|nr:META domain-containing protein [Bacilli bacterium]MDD4734458.1 META domain-containing protein [Bacilli bacterium]
MKYYLVGLIILLSVFGMLFFSPSKNDLKGTDWILIGWSVSSKDHSLAQITISFNDKISGNGGINIYNGKYLIKSNNQLQIKDLSFTEMASSDKRINENETTYFYLLGEVRFYYKDENTLKLLGENKNELLIYKKKS